MKKDFETTHSPYAAPNNFEVMAAKDTVAITLMFPPWDQADAEKTGKKRFIEINQESVRASDGIRVWYDFDRDGLVIEQPREHWFRTDCGGLDSRTEWIETAFAQSWAFDEESARSKADAMRTKKEIESIL